MSFQFKIILCGPAAVGKTSIVNRFVHDEFKTSYSMTIGADFLTKTTSVGKGKEAVKLNIWDIGGQDRFKMIRKTYYQGTAGALMIFDLTRPTTFEDLKNKWYHELVQFGNADIPFILIGNKLDLVEHIGTTVEREKAEAFAKEKNSIYIETSAKSGENIEAAFQKLTDIIVGKTGYKF